MRYDLPSTLSYAHIANRELPVVTPIGIKSWVFFMCRYARQIIQHALDLDFAKTLDECFERFVFLTLHHISTCEALHHFRDALRGNRSHCQAVRTRVVRPLAAKHHLEVWNSVVPGVTADA